MSPDLTVWNHYFRSHDYNDFKDVDFSLANQVLGPNFNGGRYFFQNNSWAYCSSDMRSLAPMGVVKASLDSLKRPFFYLHIKLFNGHIHLTPGLMRTLHEWAICYGRFYPLFVWRYAYGGGKDKLMKERIEPYVIVPKEGDGVLLEVGALA